MHPLLVPPRLYSRDEVLARPSPVPAMPGVYAWFFRHVPTSVPVASVHRHDGCALLYVGISPSRPPTSGKPLSRQNLRKRIRCHFRGNAAGSTLRLTLGTLLAPELGIQLVCVGTSGRRTFAAGERSLSEWMARNALVCWLPHPAPWEEEARLVAQQDLPLNLAGNQHHPFAPQLSALRAAAAAQADSRGA